MKKIILLVIISLAVLTTGCYEKSQTDRDAITVERQQSQYAKGQPIPAFDWSLERELVIKLYNLRNSKVSTSTVWRSRMGQIEGSCSSMGYGIPYDTSLTNPEKLSSKYMNASVGRISGVVGQAEPNGIFASTHTSATWVMCVGKGGQLEPHYVEATVNVYPYPIKIDWDHNRVLQAGSANKGASIKISK